MPGYCTNVPGYCIIKVLVYAWILRTNGEHMPGYCTDMHWYALICLNMPGYCTDMPGYCVIMAGLPGYHGMPIFSHVLSSLRFHRPLRNS